MTENNIKMHSSFYVSDLQETISFYNKFFEMEPEKVKQDYVKYILNEPGLVISFIENKDRVQSRFGHMGFMVPTEEDLNLRLWKAKKVGIVSKEEKGTNCCYARQDKFWVTDPDGIQWEVYYFHEDVEFNDPSYDNDKETNEVCCAN
jgi:catechol 2,3-dioxygenase-like lactoylglutathione lyase family enzyme